TDYARRSECICNLDNWEQQPGQMQVQSRSTRDDFSVAAMSLALLRLQGASRDWRTFSDSEDSNWSRRRRQLSRCRHRRRKQIQFGRFDKKIREPPEPLQGEPFRLKETNGKADDEARKQRWPGSAETPRWTYSLEVRIHRLEPESQTGRPRRTPSAPARGGCWRSGSGSSSTSPARRHARQRTLRQPPSQLLRSQLAPARNNYNLTPAISMTSGPDSDTTEESSACSPSPAALCDRCSLAGCRRAPTWRQRHRDCRAAGDPSGFSTFQAAAMASPGAPAQHWSLGSRQLQQQQQHQIHLQRLYQQQQIPNCWHACYSRAPQFGSGICGQTRLSQPTF
ncbi:hypothetical protein BOX15_Mlig001624g1, partial [Macrostomum lignano]